ncbi:MAG: carboxypeptidase regulatory-like domain-containing protein, partial [Bacteroidota bacterium]
NYSISNVPDGTYLGRASFANDDNVMDPDWIVKNGEPYITVDGADNILNFSVTNAIPLLSPTNESISVSPVDIPIGTAIFRWAPYPSATEYVIEVMDANSRVIWGGFSEDWSTRNVVVPSSQTEIVFNSDNTASETLIPGKIYRWKLYASKDDRQSTTGWRLISASEDQMGLFSIVD